MTKTKACLDSVALSLKQKSRRQGGHRCRLQRKGKGNRGEGREARSPQQAPEGGENFAGQRAVDAKDYLVTDQGIDASRITVMTSCGRRPVGAELPGARRREFLQRREGNHAGERNRSEAASAQASA